MIGLGGHKKHLWELGFSTIRELEVENGILASGRGEAYGCIFGRDSLITALTLLSVYEKQHEKKRDPYLAGLVRKVLLNLSLLQGREVNVESGEEPGKCIHEFRPEKHEHLTRSLAVPWYVYPDNVMRNYDTVDATPLFLIACYEYLRVCPDDATFRALIMPHVERGLSWVLEYGDSNSDGLIDYQLHPDREFGGLTCQSWMDSRESLFFEGTKDPSDKTSYEYPIAPVEVQAYTYRALLSWGSHYVREDSGRATRLFEVASALRGAFNKKFVLPQERGGVELAFAIDGTGRVMRSPRSNMGHVLWAQYQGAQGPELIVDSSLIKPLVRRLMQPDLFAPRAGFYTLSQLSLTFDPQSYHNGSIWPHDTGMIAQGIASLGYTRQAARVRRALTTSFAHFNTAIELFSYTEHGHQEYRTPSGHTACRTQAWSAATLMAQVVS